MRITALHDADGLILAAVVTEDDYDGPLPVAGEDTEVGVFDVPTAAEGLQLEEICLNHRVNSHSKSLILPPTR